MVIMDLRHLRYVIAAAEELHFTRAAHRLDIAQPALSQQIRRLEDEIGARLFHRLTRGVELTEAGRAFLPFARASLQAADQAMIVARRAARGELGRIAIGFTSSASFNPLVTAVIGRFRDAYPDLELDLHEQATSRLIESLRAGDLHLAFLRAADDELVGLRRTPLPDEPLWAALPVRHRLAGQGRISLADLAGDPFILYPRANGRLLYDAIIAACGRSGFSPRIAQEAPQMASTVNLVAAGVGVALVPASMRQIKAPGVAYTQLSGTPPVAALSLVQAPDAGLNPAIRHLLRCLEDLRIEVAA
ncbi:MAG: LysR family transcriptional regulator [Candidatus Brevundimonas colombiensis]|uniref:LysR family transcriptional regulator n=1 Tax=Candidatus Brevundimonas colombiensis TaxID=3121376 RepID=A0AAJ5X134_9CAUL|nr:LysR family transcriptional regulator [Brevundimonas sp.]WEK39133.1 MAG: LysR family transcriptional regulator [Brevundimonas sp.]